MPRIPPYSQEAENAVIGAILRGGKDVFYRTTHMVTAGDFFIGAMGTIYQAMADLLKSSSPIDPVTVGNLLIERKQIKAVGGAIALSKLLDSVATTANVEYYSRIISDKAAVRRVIVASEESVARGFENPEDVDGYLSDSVSRMNSAMRHRTGSGDFLNADQDLDRVLRKIVEGEENSNVIPTGYYGIDSVYGGIVSPLLYLVGGRPSMGKSTLLLNLAVKLAQAKRRVLFVTLEDSAEMQQQRMLSMFSGVPLIAILRRSLNDNDRNAVLDSTRHVHALPLTFSAKRGLYAEDIRRKALAYQAEHGLDALMVDHLGYIRGPAKEYDRNSMNIRAMADLGGELGVPLFLAYQLNRDLEKRDDKRPRLSDLRGTGTAEEDARAIWFVYRPHVYNKNESPNMFELIVAKASFGPLVTVELKCDMRCYRVGDMPATHANTDEY